jgi:hypothetical protein
MAIDFSSVLKDILTWATAAKVAGGVVLHKIWTWVVKVYDDAKSDVKKVV